MFASPDAISLARTFYWKPDMLDEFARFVGKGGRFDRVLDAGCSVGYLTRILADKLDVGHIVGVDVNPTAIDIAKKQVASHRPEGKIFYRVGDLKSADDLDESFDLVFAHHLLIDVLDAPSMLPRLLCFTKPGGIVCCIEPIFQTDLLNSFLPHGLAAIAPVLQHTYHRMIVDIPRELGLQRTIAPSIPKRFIDLGIQDIEIKVHADYIFSYDYDSGRLDLLRRMATQTLSQQSLARQSIRQHPQLGHLTDQEIDDFVAAQVQTCQEFLDDPQRFVESGQFAAGMHIMVRGRKPLSEPAFYEASPSG